MSYAPNFDPRTGKYSMPKRSMRRRRAIPTRGSTRTPDIPDIFPEMQMEREMIDDAGELNVSYAPRTRPRPRVKPRNINPSPTKLPDFQVPSDPIKRPPNSPKGPSPKANRGPQGSKPATRAPRAPRGPQSVAPRGPKGPKGPSPKGPSPKAQKAPKPTPKALPRRRAQAVKPKPTPKAPPRRRVIAKKR